mgnify:CR=1 FL=1
MYRNNGHRPAVDERLSGLIEQYNCVYCGYGNGVLAYAREVAARTEQYWCPIKHARKVLGRHSRYHDFIDFGDAEHYHGRLAEYRQKLG